MKYTVQLEAEPESATSGGAYWVDIATVEVEKRSKRATVIKRALAEANIQPSADKLRLRVLDAESAKVYEPEAHQPPAEWRLR